MDYYRKLLYLLVVIFLLVSISSQHVNTGYVEVKSGRNRFDSEISMHDLKKSIHFAKETVSRLRRLEKNLNWSEVRVAPNTPDHAFFTQSKPDQRASKQATYAYVAVQAADQLKHKYCRKLKLPDGDCLDFLHTHKLYQTKLFPICFERSKVCSNFDVYAKYRTADGACNHPYDAALGEAGTVYKRLVGPDYLDGIQRVRNSVTRSKLPSPRKISSEIFEDRDDPDASRTLNVAVWSEFVSHDLAHTVTRKMVHSDDKIACCTGNGGNLSPRHLHPFCLPVEVPESDGFYPKHNRKCMSYVRSMPSVANDCSFGALEQLNQASHYLDGSQIYGTDRKSSNRLRRFKNGQLRYQIINKRYFLRYSTDPREDCVNYGRQKCFKGGDSRLNSHPLLTTLHTIFHREHNRIAKTLKKINPHWTDDILYEESKRVVIAELQRITYEEWLPIVLGKTLPERTPDDFRDHVDPRVDNGFATAAMKFSRSMFDGTIELYDENRNVNTTLNFKDLYHKSWMVEGELNKFLVTLSTQNGQKVDLNVPDDITNHFFGNGDFGLDAISLDIQRGRDHGLPAYTTYRALCGSERAETFRELSPIIPEKTVKILSRLYKDPRDIDFLVGGLSETPLNDGLLGPTFSCILTDQFLRTKHGDRYFYSHPNQPKPFTEGQLREIRTVTLASVFCANGNVEKLQENVFKTIDTAGNYLRHCRDVPQINFEHWRETNERQTIQSS